MEPRPDAWKAAVVSMPRARMQSTVLNIILFGVERRCANVREVFLCFVIVSVRAFYDAYYMYEYVLSF